VFLAGDLDVDSGPRLEECLRVLSGQHVALDFSDVNFMDSSSVGVLVSAYNRARDQGGSVSLLGVQPPQMALFQLTGVANYLGLD
jgi:anti-anti-sigma factor